MSVAISAAQTRAREYARTIYGAGEVPPNNRQIRQMKGGGAEMFKKLRGLTMPEKKQGIIYYVCANYEDMPIDVQKKIEQLCVQIGGGEYYGAIFNVVTGKMTVKAAALACPCDETTLYRYRIKFYESWESCR
ncbi:MAG: hypothetical protein RR449_07750 [Christensenella sp.]